MFCDLFSLNYSFFHEFVNNWQFCLHLSNLQVVSNYVFCWNSYLEFVDFYIWKIGFCNLTKFLVTLIFGLTPLIPFEEWRLFYCLFLSEWLTFYPLNEMPTKYCSLSCSFKVHTKRKEKRKYQTNFRKKIRKKTSF